MSAVKEIIKSILKGLRLPVTKNMRYDLDTERIIERLAGEGKIKKCVDVGVLDGEILELFIKYVPGGKHYGVEPLPHKYRKLVEKFGDNVHVFNYALGNEDGTAVFNYVVSNPSYSGLRQRKYPGQESIQQIEVEVRKLDHLLLSEQVDLIKIDVEGAEFEVLKGARQILLQHHPFLIFEFGLGAADYYQVDADHMFSYLDECGYDIFTLRDWLKKKRPLGKDLFKELFHTNKEYYYIAEHR